jgi:hypothetical protein
LEQKKSIEFSWQSLLKHLLVFNVKAGIRCHYYIWKLQIPKTFIKEKEEKSYNLQWHICWIAARELNICKQFWMSKRGQGMKYCVIHTVKTHPKAKVLLAFLFNFSFGTLTGIFDVGGKVFVYLFVFFFLAVGFSSLLSSHKWFIFCSEHPPPHHKTHNQCITTTWRNYLSLAFSSKSSFLPPSYLVICYKIVNC